MNPYCKHTGTCRSCQAEIIWALSPAGKTLPLDGRSIDELQAAAVKIPATAYTLEEISDGPDAGKMQAVAAAADASAAYTYVSHFATCPNAGQHSSKGTRR